MSLNTERSTILATAQAIVDRAKNDHRELTVSEADQVEAAITQVNDLDRRKSSGDLVRRVLALGPTRDPEATAPVLVRMPLVALMAAGTTGFPAGLLRSLSAALTGAVVSKENEEVIAPRGQPSPTATSAQPPWT